jgi:hypothetical protein
VSGALDYLRSEHGHAYEVAAWVREAVLEADPDLTERVYRGWRGVGFRHPEAGYVCGIFPGDEAVELLFEHGASLPDPDGILGGEGTQTRVIRVAAPDPTLRGQIGAYVQQAVAQRLL